MSNVSVPRTAPPALAPDATALRTTALFLDVDGVLLGFAAHPAAVRVPDALLARLEALHAALGGALALVSGRAIATLDALFAPLTLPCAGLHGLERRNHAELVRVPADASALDAVRAAARTVVARYPGALCEDKGIALALHWRGEPLAAADLQALAASAAMQLPGYHLQPGDHVVELKPAAADKGAAIEAFLQEPPFAGRTPVFAGDDLTDEHGFETVNARGGTSILVGMRTPSAARYALPDVEAVHRWLGVGEAMRPQVAA
jgi:trehalose 6-phosphate phosphatase